MLWKKQENGVYVLVGVTKIEQIDRDKTSGDQRIYKVSLADGSEEVVSYRQSEWSNLEKLVGEGGPVLNSST